MCSDCSDWKLRGIAKRDFQHSKDGPEIIEGSPKRKSKWCRNKTGREHNFKRVVWYSYKYIDSYGKEQVNNSYRWVCQGCGKVSWGIPQPSPHKHDHHFCQTEIVEWGWRRYDEIKEICCVCGRSGRSYKFYK